MQVPKQLRPVKTQLLLLCLLQGVVFFTLGLYTMVYIPDILADTKPVTEPITRAPKPNKTALSDITHAFASKDGETYILFRFNRFFNGFEYDNWEDLLTEKRNYAYFEPGYMSDEIPDWFNIEDVFCGGCLKIHGKRIGYLVNATINPDLVTGNEGGEEVANIMHQPLEMEYVTLAKGFIQMVSEHELHVASDNTLSIDLRTFLNAFDVIQSENAVSQSSAYRDRLAVLVTRYEYANFYHTTMNWYDVFFTMVLFNVQPQDVDVFWIDAHPKSSLDDTWEKLFGKYRRVRALRTPLTYQHMVWNGFGARSQVNSHKQEDLPFINEYRHFVLSRYRVDPDHIINCNQLRVTIIWRRSYIAHPRNPDGFVPRQIYNEDEVWKTVSNTLPTAIVNGVQLDTLTMLEQLELITTTDILIGMHGAGLSHILYLPKTSGVIEFFTMRTSPGNAHFRSMAKWRRVPYLAWINPSKRNEMPEHKTYIPPVVLKDMVLKMKETLCGQDDNFLLNHKNDM